jgi:nitrite reductase/ring-hydroxylating ferredoxin subunit
MPSASTAACPDLAQRYIVATVGEIAPGANKLVRVAGREIGVFNIDGSYYALLSKCPHKGAELCKGKVVHRVVSDEPGQATVVPNSEMIRCPWHGYQYDLRTGQSWCDADNAGLRRYATSVETGSGLLEGPFVAETYAVSLDESYVLVEV